jgi:two-component system, LytTR family, response regulator
LKLRCLIIDDEFLARQLIQGYAQKVPFLEVVDLCENALEAADLLHHSKIDLLFLDVNMPELSGIDFIKTLKHKPEIIITTAYSDHALEGYQLDVIEYLLKPIYFDRFLQAVNKAREHIELKLKASQVDKAASSTTTFDGNCIFIKTGQQQIKKIKLSDITYIESLHEYVRIHLANESFTIHHSLKGLVELLPGDQFVQIHRSFVINFNRITAIEGNTAKLDTVELAIGKNFRDDFFSRIKSSSIGVSGPKSGPDRKDGTEHS